jgi:hypothetical protein
MDCALDAFEDAEQLWEGVVVECDEVIFEGPQTDLSFHFAELLVLEFEEGLE